jgi:hypothetical protein
MVSKKKGKDVSKGKASETDQTDKAKSKKASKRSIATESTQQHGSNESGSAQRNGEAVGSIGTVTSTESSRVRGKRGASQMYKVLVKKAVNKKVRVRYNSRGNPCGETRPNLQSYIGMLARKMVPINIDSWTKVPGDLKEKLWQDIQVERICCSNLHLYHYEI